MTEINEKTLIDLYNRLLKTRRLEERIIELYTNAEFPGMVHPALGQEAVGVGIAFNLRKDDYITYSHRGRPILVGKGADLKRFMAEVFGRRDGACRGRAGEAHYMDREAGILNYSLVIGESIPFAAGVALSVKYRSSNQVTVAFFGDGAAETGGFHETMNVASLWELPLLFVCENNGWAQFTPQKRSTKVCDVYKKAAAHGIPSDVVDGEDVEAVYLSASKAISHVREGNGPMLLECKTYRWLGHFVGDQQKYRDQNEVDEARKHDPLKRFQEKLLGNGVLTETVINELEGVIRNEIDMAVEFAKSCQFPDPKDAVNNIYAKEILI